MVNNGDSTLQRTREGWELQLATNCLGHFALTLRLHDSSSSNGHHLICIGTSGSGQLAKLLDNGLTMTNLKYAEALDVDIASLQGGLVDATRLVTEACHTKETRT